eukprot:scpid89910/ scgid29903/ 
MERSSRKFGGGHQDRWESWWLQFQQVALVNGWTPQESVQFLPLALKGKALLFYQALPQAVRQGRLAALAQALQARFAPAQRDKKSLGEYCEAVCELGCFAYPPMQDVDRDLLSKDQFLSGLDSRAMRVRIRELNVATLDEALQAALQYDAIHQAESVIPSAPAPVSVFASASADPQPQLLAKLLDRLDLLEAKLSATQPRSEPVRPAVAGDHPPRRAPTVQCWHCGKLGHVRHYKSRT